MNNTKYYIICCKRGFPSRNKRKMQIEKNLENFLRFFNSQIKIMGFPQNLALHWIEVYSKRYTKTFILSSFLKK